MERWFVDVAGEATGPVDGNALTLRVSSREFGPTTRLRREGDADTAWVELKDVPRFARVLPGTRAPLPRLELPRPAPMVTPPPLGIPVVAIAPPPAMPAFETGPRSAPITLSGVAPPPAEVAKLETVLARVIERRDDPRAHGTGEAFPDPHAWHREPTRAPSAPSAPSHDGHWHHEPSRAAPPPQRAARPSLARARQEEPEEPATFRRRGGGRGILPWMFAFAAASLAFGVWLKLHPEDGSHAQSPAATRPSSALDAVGIVDQATGFGRAAKAGDRVKVQYKATLVDGTEFDSSHDGTFAFTLGKGSVIKGWEEGIVGMKVGGRRTLTIPPSLAYGARGMAPKVPPNATVIFDVKLVEFGK